MQARVALTYAPWLLAIPQAAALLGVDRVVHAHARPRAGRHALVAVAGDAPQRARAARLARSRGIEALHVAPGLVDLAPPLRAPRHVLALALDLLDEPFTERSSLEARLARPLDAEAWAYAERMLARLRAGEVSLHNRGRALGRVDEGHVLVVAQDDALDACLGAARSAHPEATLVVLTRTPRAARDPRVRFAPIDAHPASLLEGARHVYVHDDRVGFEALLRGVPLTCLGAPFYAGRGLSEDRASLPGRRACTLEALFHASCVEGTRYVDPETGRPTTFDAHLDFLARQRMHALPGGGPVHALGFSPWKRTFVPTFLGAPANEVRFTSAARAPRESTLVAWGTRQDAALEGRASWRMEDGFLRSVGLGSDSHLPASLVVDTRGIYFDPSRPSDLEHLLEHGDFTEGELARAAYLRARIVEREVSKYNVAARTSLSLDEAGDRPIALVIGQVEDDASIRLGTLDVRTNLALLRAAREARPEAFIVYKPHPDVTSGNREGHVPEAEARVLADRVVTDVSVGACLRVAHEVHTMTSFVGFEALLRGLRVHVYGQPFYAGWGLTLDRHPHARRTRARTLDALVAATLIRYPRYVHPRTGLFTTPEAIVDHLVEAKSSARQSAFEHTFIVRYGRMLVEILRRDPFRG